MNTTITMSGYDFRKGQVLIDKSGQYRTRLMRPSLGFTARRIEIGGQRLADEIG